MSVLTLPLLPDTNPQCGLQTPDLLLVTKGAPESVIKACDKATVPAGHQARLSDMAAQGYRVLACATKVLRGIDATRASHLQQAALETGMAFAGFLVMGNQVKAQTGAVLQAVTRAGVRQCMITGDNVLTAVAVARDSAESNMWQSGAGGEAWLMEVNVAITGAAISELYEEHLTRCQGTASALVLLLKHTHVYARAAPREKQLIVRCLQGLGHVVCMVGDGANDSFALKSADAGLSIAGHERDPSESAAEDTLAVPSIAAPFSTPIAHIGAVPLLLREGRCALATSLVSFRYMFQYGVTQFMATSLLYVHLSTLSAWQFLIADLVNTLPLVMVLNLTASADHLQAGLPFTKLGSWRFVGALAGNCAIICLGQVLQFLALRAQSFYDPLSAKEGSQGDPSQEDTMLFLSSTFMYLTQAIALCHNYGGFRANATTNKPLVAIVLVLFTFNSALFLVPTAAAQSWLQMVDTIPWWFLFASWLWALACGAALVAFEHFCVVKREGFWFERQRQQTAGGKLLSLHMPFTKQATISATAGSSPRYTLV
ncbi:HAD-like domain-containing protein [Tribonema minus]|uniref:HAD-like domain-containing protein n=1 Tax=Tribonema minus TaxID=303371 RepID=A0A835Z7F1_9STRA|nr:HAD-like domain-containing protein [Tribonema minus]